MRFIRQWWSENDPSPSCPLLLSHVWRRVVSCASESDVSGLLAPPIPPAFRAPRSIPWRLRTRPRPVVPRVRGEEVEAILSRRGDEEMSTRHR